MLVDVFEVLIEKITWIFFFSSRIRHTRCGRDWSSDVCSSDLEGMPLVALQTGVPWSWESFGDYLAALEGRIAVNAGFLVGHCALRRYVMGEAAVGEKAADDQIAEMVRLLHECIE